jgi:hypothetical protein
MLAASADADVEMAMSLSSYFCRFYTELLSADAKAPVTSQSAIRRLAYRLQSCWTS